MRLIIRSIFVTILTTGQLLVFLPSRAPVLAHGNEADSQVNSTEQIPAHYDYVAPAGCSLSLLARRSLQVYDQEKQELSLSPEQIIYAETNIVQRLGSRLLEINEKVAIEHALIEEYATKSQMLSAAAISAWQPYANLVDFSDTSVNPVAITTAGQENPTDESAKSAEESAKNNQQTTQSSSSAWYIWLAVIAAFGSAYYLMDKPFVKKLRRK